MSHRPLSSLRYPGALITSLMLSHCALAQDATLITGKFRPAMEMPLHRRDPPVGGTAADLFRQPDDQEAWIEFHHEPPPPVRLDAAPTICHEFHDPDQLWTYCGSHWALGLDLLSPQLSEHAQQVRKQSRFEELHSSLRRRRHEPATVILATLESPSQPAVARSSIRFADRRPAPPSSRTGRAEGSPSKKLPAGGAHAFDQLRPELNLPGLPAWSEDRIELPAGDSGSFASTSLSTGYSGWDGRLPQTAPFDVDLTSPRVGMIYQLPAHGLSGYYSFSQSQLTMEYSSGDSLPYEDLAFAEIHQTGIRYENDTGEWTLTAGGFYLSNELAQDSLATAPGRMHGFDSGHGVQLRIAGSLTPRWSTEVNVTRIELQNPVGMDGTTWRIPNVVTTATAALWLRYAIIQEETQRLRGGVGVRIADGRKSSYSHSLIFPGYTRWDFGVFYEHHRWLDARLFLEGVLDRRYGDPSSVFGEDSPLSLKGQVFLRY